MRGLLGLEVWWVYSDLWWDNSDLMGLLVFLFAEVKDAKNIIFGPIREGLRVML
jgi:hypothetical protein